MKTLAIISALLFMGIDSIGQSNRIDNLIEKLDNNKLVGVCNYFWILKNGCREVDTLIELSSHINSNGKPIQKEIVEKLISLLSDPKKGIIAHYTLSNISTRYISQGSEFQHDGLLTIRYTYNELEFYWDKVNNMFATPEQLLKIRRMWEERFTD